MEQQKALTYNSFTTKGGNIVWAAAMQLAWNQLREQFTSNHPITLKTENQTSLQIVKNFNEGKFKKAHINKDSIYVKSGYGQATLNTINAQLKKKFPQKQIPPFEGPLNDSDIISFAYLYKQLLFDIKFDKREELQFEFNGKEVKSFYAQNLKQKKQVLVHQYHDQGTFMVEIQGKNNEDSLFLIKNKAVKTVDDAINLTLQGRSQHPSPLKKRDYFQMPVVTLNADRHFNELIGLKFLNQELSQYFIRVMFEAVKLNIDESGAKVENQAVIVATRCMMAADQEQPKIIHLNSSFWAVMAQAGKTPYLCVYIQNPNEQGS